MPKAVPKPPTPDATAAAENNAASQASGGTDDNRGADNDRDDTENNDSTASNPAAADGCSYPVCVFANGDAPPPQLDQCQKQDCCRQLHHGCQTQAEHTASVDGPMVKCCYDCHPDRDKFLPNPGASSANKTAEAEVTKDVKEDIPQEQLAAIEVLCMLTNADGHTLYETAYSAMMEICVSELGFVEDEIPGYIQNRDERGFCAYWVDSKEEYTTVHRTLDGETIGEPELRNHANVTETVDRDLARLICAATEGDLVIKSWYIDLPHKWRKTRLPPFKNYARSHHRARFLHRILEKEHITLMHNSIVTWHLPSSLCYLLEYCVGYHCHTTVSDMEEGESAFCGNSVSLRLNSILKAVHESISLPSDTELRETQENKDASSVPDESTRETTSYRSLFADREVLMSLDELKERIGKPRVNKLVEKWRRNYIIPDGRDVLTYFREHYHCHMIMPGLWLGENAICSNPHFLDELVRKLYDSLLPSQVDRNTTAEADAGEALLRLAGAVTEESSSRSKKKRPVRKYEEIRTDPKNLYCIDQAMAMLEYLEKGDENTDHKSVMMMLRGEIQGAIKENDSGDNVYVTSNFFRALQIQLTKQDRWFYYHVNKGTEHGRFMSCVAVAVNDLRKCMAEALSVFNRPGFEYLMRVGIPIPMFKNHIIQHGGDDRPITKMVCMVTMNNYCRTALEVHQFEFLKDIYSYK